MTDEEIKAMQDENTRLADESKSLRAENAKRRTSSKTLEQQLDDLNADKDRLQKEKEQSDLEAKGKYDEASAKLRETLTSEKQKETERATKFEQLFKAEKIDKALISAASGTVNPETAATLAKQRFSFDVDDGGSVVIKRGDSPALNKDGKAMDFKAVIESIKESDPYLVASTGGGTGSTGGTGSGVDGDAAAMRELAALAGLK